MGLSLDVPSAMEGHLVVSPTAEAAPRSRMLVQLFKKDISVG